MAGVIDQGAMKCRGDRPVAPAQPDPPQADRAEIKISKRKVAAVESGDGQRFIVFEAGKRPAAIRLDDILAGATPNQRKIINCWFEGGKRGG